MSEPDQKRENPVRRFVKDRLAMILVVLFLLFIWPTPFEMETVTYGPDSLLHPLDPGGGSYSHKVWRLTGTPAPWE